MSAYLIVNGVVFDPVVFEQYRARVPALIQKHGGEYLVRGGQFEVLEGDWKPSRVVLLRFPDVAAARAFYNDPEYAPLITLRQRGSKLDMVLVEGA